MKPKLVILSTNFGKNFSGGCLATHEIFKNIQGNFSEVVFLGQQVGKHDFSNLVFRSYKSRRRGLKILRELKREHCIFYGDFYMTYLFILAKVDFYFTYHDNWPELGKQSFGYWLQSLWMVPLYQWIITRSKWTFTVSDFKMRFVEKQTKNCSVVRNGVSLQSSNLSKNEGSAGTKKVLMIGNVDARKYREALRLFQLLTTEISSGFQIDVYGHQVDRAIAQKMERYPFVRLKGFSDQIDFTQYQLLLSTSVMENLAISVVEALSHRVPVLAYDVGGLSEVVKSGVNGFLVPSGQWRAMGNRLLEMLESRFDFSFKANDLESYNWELASAEYKKIMLIA